MHEMETFILKLYMVPFQNNVIKNLKPLTDFYYISFFLNILH